MIAALLIAVTLQAEPPVCGERYEDIWGFAVSIPNGRCGDPYVHGIYIRLADGGAERSITVFAAYTPEEFRNVHDMAKYAEDGNIGLSKVVKYWPVVLAGVRGERWKARDGKLVREDVYVLRRLKLDYEYIFTLVTTRNDYDRDRRTYEKFLQSVSFEEPER